MPILAEISCRRYYVALPAIDSSSKELMKELKKVGSTQSTRRFLRRAVPVRLEGLLIATIGLALTVSSNPVDASAAGDPISLFALLADEGGEGAPDAPSVESPFRFELREVTNHRGPAVEGYLYNGLRWRIGSVRVRVESLDPTGQVSGEAYGWALGDVPAGGRTYFVVPIATRGATYHATVDSFDRMSREDSQSP